MGALYDPKPRIFHGHTLVISGMYRNVRMVFLEDVNAAQSMLDIGYITLEIHVYKLTEGSAHIVSM